MTDDNNNKKPIIINLNAAINLDSHEIGRLTGKHLLRNISGGSGIRRIVDVETDTGDCE
jgi:hypothetical protein